MSLVALCVEIDRIDGREVFTFISFPRIDLVIVGIEQEAGKPTEVEYRICLYAISAAKVVGAVDDVLLVAAATTEKDATKEDVLLKAVKISHMRESIDNSRSNRCRL